MLLGIAIWVRQFILGLGVTGLESSGLLGSLPDQLCVSLLVWLTQVHLSLRSLALQARAGANHLPGQQRQSHYFHLPFGVAAILIDMGRPERILNLVFYGRYASPLLWDVSAVGLYLLSSIVFFYLSLLPDIAICRDRVTDIPGWKQKMYRVLALGLEGY